MGLGASRLTRSPNRWRFEFSNIKQPLCEEAAPSLQLIPASLELALNGSCVLPLDLPHDGVS
jgi:hypothetical protein